MLKTFTEISLSIESAQQSSLPWPERRHHEGDTDGGDRQPQPAHHAGDDQPGALGR